MNSPNPNARGIRVKVSPAVLALTRANTVAHISRSIGEAAGLSDRQLKIIFEGFQEQMIDEVVIRFLGSSNPGDIIAILTMSCDWDRQMVILSSPSGRREFSFDTSQPVPGQISKALDACTSFIVTKLGSMNIAARKLSFSPRADRLAEFRERFGTSPMAEDVLQHLNNARLQRNLRVSPGALEEFAVSFLYRED